MKIKMKNKKKKIIITIISCLLSLLILTAGIGALYIHNLYGKLQFNGTDSFEINSSIADDEYNDNYQNSINDSNLSELEQSIINNYKDNATEIAYDKNVCNILFIGVDSRENNYNCRSDSMILLSINKSTKKIVMTSFLRDIYISIPQCGFNRLNAANAFGGPNLLLQTLKNNFKIQVDMYAVVNFYSFMNVIDTLGGVTVNVTEAEQEIANKYIHELNSLLNLDTNNGLITATGDITLTGKQALGYARNRYTGSDFDRTDRQREVLVSAFSKIKSSDILTINDLLNKLLPQILTNVPEGVIYSLILSLPDIKNYQIEQLKIPLSDAYKGVTIHGMSVLDIDYAECIAALKKTIYNK